MIKRNFSFLKHDIVVRLYKQLVRPHLEYAVQVYKIVHGFDNLSFSDFFRFTNSKITRGHCLKLQKVQSRINIRRNFFSQRVVNEWNGLPEDVVIVGSVNGFKNALDKYFKLCNKV